MSSGSPLDEWKFLMGKWKGTMHACENEFGEKGVVESTHVFSAELARARSCIREISDNKIAMGLERAEGDGEFERFG